MRESGDGKGSHSSPRYLWSVLGMVPDRLLVLRSQQQPWLAKLLLSCNFHSSVGYNKHLGKQRRDSYGMP